jgi:hypothetical protein
MSGDRFGPASPEPEADTFIGIGKCLTMASCIDSEDEGVIG